MREVKKRAPAVLILAAGRGRRMGLTKAMAPWCGGTLLDDAIYRACQLRLHVQVMVGAGFPLVRYRCAAVPTRWCRVPHWQEGMAASLRDGVRRLPRGISGVLVMPVDQPLVPVSHLKRLVEQAQAQPERPAATEAEGRIMAPAYLPVALWRELKGLQGDHGARYLLRNRDTAVLPCQEAAADINTWQALRQADPEWVSPADLPARQCPRRIRRG